MNDVLEALNNSAASNPYLPPEGIVRVIQELMDPIEFEQANLDRLAALEDLNQVLGRDGLLAYLDGAGKCFVKNIGTPPTHRSCHLLWGASKKRQT